MCNNIQEYLVTDISRISPKKSLVSVNYEKSFALYNSEIEKYNIELDVNIDQNTLDYINNQILYPRAKERAFNLLARSSKTVCEMRTKLKEGYYSDIICDRVISFLSEYGYLNDFEYAYNFVMCNQSSKTINAMKNCLRRKGIEDRIILETFQNFMDVQEDGISVHNEVEMIRKYISKKRIEPLAMDYKERNRVVNALIRRGYRYEDINTVINQYN